MNREIKFRAWDESNEVMHHNFQFFSSGNESNDWIVFASVEEPQIADNKQIILNNPYFRQQIKIMQYTGLKDKNGKEIYEGDILMILDERTRCVIEYGGGWFYGRNIEKSTQHIKSIYDQRNWLMWQVVGNIYETPELIK